MAKQFGKKLKELRIANGMLQRQVAAAVDLDGALYSKIERGERTAKKETVELLVTTLKANKKELTTLWLADQVTDIVQEEAVAYQALKTALEDIKRL